MSKWLRFTEVLVPALKTKFWHVHSTTGAYLGTVKWYGKWRRYAFHVANLNVVLEETCLSDIASFVEAATKVHKMERQ